MVKEELGESHELARSLRWLYIGEVGSGTSAHADPLASHGWMWLAAGRKDWRFVNWKAKGVRQRCEAVPEGAPKDLFESSSCPELAAWLQKNEAMHEAWFGELNTGELIFVPSAILHSVRNRGTRTSIAVSHNFVDSTCVDAVLECLQQALSMLLEGTAQLGAQQREATERTEDPLTGALLDLGRSRSVDVSAPLCTCLLRDDGDDSDYY
eukprot:s3601_g5.t1